MKYFSDWTLNVFDTVGRIVRRFNSDDSLTLSGAMSFYFLLSVLPLALLTLSVLGFVLGSSSAALSAVTTLGKIESILPEGAINVERFLSTMVSGKKIFGGIGLLLLAWFAGGVFYTVEVAVNRIFRTGQRRGFFHKTVIVYFFMLVSGCLLTVSIGITVLATIVSDLSVSLFGIDPAKIPFLLNAVFSVVPPILIMSMFTIIYIVGPTAKVQLASALKGGMLGGILWEISRRVMGWYISNLAVYHKLYGALGTLAALFIWIFYCSNVFLIGAEYAAICNERYEMKIAKRREIEKKISI